MSHATACPTSSPDKVGYEHRTDPLAIRNANGKGETKHGCISQMKQKSVEMPGRYAATIEAADDLTYDE